MECRDVQKLLSEYIDGVLAESLAPVVKQHIATCDQCRDTYHSMNRLIGVMREMEPVDEPADFRAGVRARLEKRPSIARRLRPLYSPPMVKVPLGVAAALVVAVIISVLPRPERPAPDQPTMVGSKDFDLAGTSDKREKKTTLDDDEAGVATHTYGRTETEKKGPDPLTPGLAVPESGQVIADAGRGKEADRPVSGAAGDQYVAEGTPKRGDLTNEIPAEKQVAAARTESLDAKLDIDALMEVTAMEKQSEPAPPGEDSTVTDAVTVWGGRAPVDARVAAAGGKLVDTVRNEDGETVALIARVPADSLQAVYRLFGRANVTFAADTYGAPDTSSQYVESARRRSTLASRQRSKSAANATSPTDSVLVRIRIRP